MKTNNEKAAPSQVVIPPLPGGGSWRWNGTEWIAKSVPADKAAPVLTQSNTEE